MGAGPSGPDAVTDAARRVLENLSTPAAEDALEECLKILDQLPEAEELKVQQLLALSEALTGALELAPGLASAGHMALAFRAAAVVAWLARRARSQDLWRTPLLDHLQLYGRLISAAWTDGGPLVNQPIDNNRYIVLLGEVMCNVSELSVEQRGLWSDLAARCLRAPDLWVSRYFSLHLQGLLAAVRAGPQNVPALSMSILQVPEGSLDRVLAFKIAWAKELPPSSLDATWAAAASTYTSPGARYLAAFFAERLAVAHPLRASVLAMLEPALRDESLGIWRPLMYSTALKLCGPRPEMAGILLQALWQVLPPEAPLEELRGLQGSPLCSMVPELCVALSRCLTHMTPEHQLACLLDLEHWAAEVHALHATAAPYPARRWLLASAFFAVSTVVREAQLAALPPRSLLSFLRSLSCVDRFREDSPEYRAICMSLVECGRASGEAFEQGLLDTCCELSDAGSDERLFFWLGIMSMAEIQDFRHAFSALLRCLPSPTLGARALAVAPRSFEVLRPALAAAQAGSQLMRVLQHTIGEFMDAASDSEARWLLGVLQQRCRDAQDSEVDFFHLLALALRREAPSTVQAMVQGLLAARPAWRETFAAHLCSSFPEKSREVLVGWLIQLHPDAAYASRDARPAIGEPQPVLRSAL